MGWGQVCRIRHVTSGRYLAVTPDNQVVTLHRNKADEESTAFCLRQSKVRPNAMHLFTYRIFILKSADTPYNQEIGIVSFSAI